MSLCKDKHAAILGSCLIVFENINIFHHALSSLDSSRHVCPPGGCESGSQGVCLKILEALACVTLVWIFVDVGFVIIMSKSHVRIHGAFQLSMDFLLAHDFAPS